MTPTEPNLPADFPTDSSTVQRFSDQEKAALWIEKIKKAERYKESWEKRFKAAECEKYYEGFHYAEEDGLYSPYVINLIFSTIEIQRPNLLFEGPIASIKPKPARESWNSEAANLSARVKEDALNTFLTDEDNNVAEEIELAVLDSYFRFGIVEVGFSADWTENPNADKPLLDEDGTILQDSEGNPIKQPSKVPILEQNYIKRIQAKQFLVGGYDKQRLDRCGWVGYWDWVSLADIAANSNFKNLDNFDYVSGRSDDYVELNDSGEIVAKGDLCKVYFIWDLRSKTKYIIAFDQSDVLFEQPFSRLPLFPLVFHKRTKGFFPIPPVFNWLSPQNEINETREMMRIHRRRGVRKYLYNKSILNDQQEIDKLEYGGDQTFVGVEGNPQEIVAPLPLADLGSSQNQSMVVSKDDFNIISATSAESRGQGDRVTATAANITDRFAQIRSSFSSKIVAKWLKSIFREILLQMQEKNTLPFWIKKTEGDLFSFQLLDPASLEDDYDFEVDISVTSLSVIASDERKKNFLEFLAVLSQYQQLAMSPDLVREAATVIGYRNEKVIAQFMEMAQLAMIGQIEMGKQAVGNALAQRQVAQSTPNTGEQITNQLQNQNGLAGG